MCSILKQIQRSLSFFSVLFLLSLNAFAGLGVIKDLKPLVEAQVMSYLQDDPKCNSCRGNARSAGVTYLEYSRDFVHEQEYLRGKVWANSCQDWKNGIYAYGDVDASLGHCGYHEVQFLLPIIKNAGSWTANFERITMDLGDERSIQKIIPLKLKQKDLRSHGVAIGLAASIMLSAAQHDPRYPALQVDIEQIFELCKPHLESANCGEKPID